MKGHCVLRGPSDGLEPGAAFVSQIFNLLYRRFVTCTAKHARKSGPLQIGNLRSSTARASRNRTAQSVWSARGLLPLSRKPTVQSASKLAHSKRFATNFAHPHSP